MTEGWIPLDALHAARAARAGASSTGDEFAAALEFAASQLQPALGNLSEALGEDVDAVGFALGMIAGGFALQGIDMVAAAGLMPAQFAEFVVRARAMQGAEVCGARSSLFPSVTCGLMPLHGGKHGAGRLRW